MRRTTLALITLPLLALAALVAVGVAAAHIDPTPAKALVGRTTTVAFTVEHGCDGSPTRTLAMRMPSGLTSARPVSKAGWKITVARAGGSVRQVTWRGTLPDSRESRFAIRLGMPSTPGKTLYFPVVQRCTRGVIRWIEIPRRGQPEPEHPAPGVTLVRPR
jgi:periplasmic copper chaperone A